MSKKLYVCNECGNVYREDLNNLIEENVQVFCEKCGTPFSFIGFKLKDEKLEIEKSGGMKSKEKSSGLHSTIILLNKIAWIPILIVSIILIFTPTQFFLGIFGVIISLYDLKFISRKIKEYKYDEIVLDSFCIGIMGSIVYGAGVILLIKGILILFYAYYNLREEKLKIYDFGLQLKNSLNNFSALAGFLIILLLLHAISIGARFMMMGFFIIFIIFIPLSIVALIIDLLVIRKKIKFKQKFDILDSFGIIFIGIIGTIFTAAGIFIILKGIVIFFLSFGEPSEITMISPIEVKPEPPKYIEPVQPIEEKRFEKEIPELETIEIKKPITPVSYETPPIKLPQKKIIETKEEDNILKKGKEKLSIKKEEEIEIKLHDSLLPVKDEKDKKLVKEYFAKIFNVLSNDLRKQIYDLKIPKKEKKELLKELAFISKEEQVKYIEAIVHLYQESLPIKLIERIKKLPNVKPDYYVKISEQLKFMDYDEQLRFVRFLEDNA